MELSDGLGTLGVFLLLLAYFFQIAGWIRSDGWGYPSLNLLGALLAAWSSYLIEFIPFIVLELTWAMVSLVSLGQWLRKRPARTES